MGTIAALAATLGFHLTGKAAARVLARYGLMGFGRVVKAKREARQRKNMQKWLKENDKPQ